MKPSRGVARTPAYSAGTIASSRGSATLAPIPLKNVRRCSAFFVINIVYITPTTTVKPLLLFLRLRFTHPERRRPHHGLNHGRKSIVGRRALPHNGAHHRLIEILGVPANGVHQELRCYSMQKFL